MQKKIWLSPSTVNKFVKCPRSFYLSKLKRIKSKPSIYLIRGIAVHETISMFYDLNLFNCASGEYGSISKELVSLFSVAWGKQKESLNKLNFKKEELEFYIKDSEKMIMNFLHRFLMDHEYLKPKPSIEESIFDYELKTLGRMDKIEKGRSPPRIIDYKTSRNKEITEDIKRQMTIYHILYKRKYKQNPELLVDFLRFKDGLVKVKITEEEILIMKTTIRLALIIFLATITGALPAATARHLSTA